MNVKVNHCLHASSLLKSFVDFFETCIKARLPMYVFLWCTITCLFHVDCGCTRSSCFFKAILLRRIHYSIYNNNLNEIKCHHIHKVNNVTCEFWVLNILNPKLVNTINNNIGFWVKARFNLANDYFILKTKTYIFISLLFGIWFDP
jgi:hypothetical protein